MSEVTIQKSHSNLPVLPLRNAVVLPKNIIPIKASREFSIEAIRAATKDHEGYIFITTQSEDCESLPEMSNLHKVGIVAKILQASIEKDGSFKTLVEGVSRSKISTLAIQGEKRPYLTAKLTSLKAKALTNKTDEDALTRNLKSLFKDLVALNDKLPSDLLKFNTTSKNIERLIDSIAVHINLTTDEKQKLLSEVSLQERAILVCTLLKRETEILKAEINIRKRVENQVGEQQKQYYLNEQVRAIYKEMGKEDTLQEAQKFREHGQKLKLSKEAYEKLLLETRKIEQSLSTSPEASVSRNYVEWLLAVPWYKKVLDRVSLPGAQKILDSSHAGMEKAKERIIEFLAARKFAKGKLKTSPIVCLIGPPGVGKTSLAESVAQSLGRPMVRISLGGVKDEAEIRGHRKTYIGSMPGKIISAMRKAKVTNPVILLDEIDKMATDFRGDPSSALLEVLDPEQNKSFIDHFMEVEYDLSDVMFIATANVYDNIPYALLDRMEMISLPGYTEKDKLKIAQKFLVGKLTSDHGLKSNQVKISKQIVEKIINEYTREAGVRNLQKYLAKIIRKSIQKIMTNKTNSVTVTNSLIESWLGPVKFKPQVNEHKDSMGVATGLAWTESGGDVLEVEVVGLKGKGGLTITGQLGEVMQESAQAALSYIRSQAKKMGLKDDFYSDLDLHIHIPEGAIPKDGPSAGITMTTAITSILTKIKVNRMVAMSGEITLQGRVLSVGGLKEKLLAAKRFGVKKVVLPKDNKNDVQEFVKELEGALEIVYVEKMEEAFEHTLMESPFKKASAKKPAKKTIAKAKSKTKK